MRSVREREAVSRPETCWLFSSHFPAIGSAAQACAIVASNVTAAAYFTIRRIIASLEALRAAAERSPKLLAR